MHGGGKPSASPWSLAVAALLASTLAGRWLLAAPSPFPAPYLHVLAFILIAWVTRPGAQVSVLLPARVWRVRQALPWAAASVAVLLSNFLVQHAPWPATFALCLLLSLAMPVVQAATGAIAARTALADVPRALRGAPLAVCTCAIMALACMGFAGSMPW